MNNYQFFGNCAQTYWTHITDFRNQSDESDSKPTYVNFGLLNEERRV